MKFKSFTFSIFVGLKIQTFKDIFQHIFPPLESRLPNVCR